MGHNTRFEATAVGLISAYFDKTAVESLLNHHYFDSGSAAITGLAFGGLALALYRDRPTQEAAPSTKDPDGQ